MLDWIFSLWSTRECAHSMGMYSLTGLFVALHSLALSYQRLAESSSPNTKKKKTTLAAARARSRGHRTDNTQPTPPPPPHI